MNSINARMAAVRRRSRRCSLQDLCLPRHLGIHDLGILEGAVGSHRMQANELLYRRGDPFRSIFVVKSGGVETHIEDASGERETVGFYLPGELLGLDALRTAQHAAFAVTLERSIICPLPYYRLEELCAVMPSLRRQLMSLTSGEMRPDQEPLLSLSRRDLQQRLTLFLLDLARRWSRSGRPSAHFHLAMTLNQIASYLGTTPEALGRTLSDLHTAGLLHMRGREVALVDIPRLTEICGMRTPFLRLLSAC